MRFSNYALCFLALHHIERDISNLYDRVKRWRHSICGIRPTPPKIKLRNVEVLFMQQRLRFVVDIMGAADVRVCVCSTLVVVQIDRISLALKEWGAVPPPTACRRVFSLFF